MVLPVSWSLVRSHSFLRTHLSATSPLSLSRTYSSGVTMPWFMLSPRPHVASMTRRVGSFRSGWTVNALPDLSASSIFCTTTAIDGNPEILFAFLSRMERSEKSELQHSFTASESSLPPLTLSSALR